MFTASNATARWAIVAALAICVLGILILPQVDLPDFLTKPVGTRVLGPDRIGAESFACDQTAISVFLGHGLPLDGFNLIQLPSSLVRTTVTFGQKRISSLRC
jgi:hypothetical protein